MVQGWRDVHGGFQDIATSVDECRAECVGAYLMSEEDLLALCGYTDDGPVKPADRTCNLPIGIGARLTSISRV